MLIENKKHFNLVYITTLMIIAIGAVLGAIYYVTAFFGKADVHNQITNYVCSIKSGMNIKSLIFSSIKTYFFLFIIIFLCTYMKYGYIISLFSVAKRGFVSSFATSAMIDVYGFKGIFLSLANIPQSLIIIPFAALLVSVSFIYSKNREKFDKKEKIIYIIFSLVIFTVFCVSALCEGFLTTTFMKWLANKVT